MRIVGSTLIALGVAACGGGGPDGEIVGGPGVAPATLSAALQVTFPPGGSATDGAATMVCGRVTGGSADAVYVNGHLATTVDGFATWVCKVPLIPGPNDVTIEAIESDGGRSVEVGPVVHRQDLVVRAPIDIAGHAGGIVMLDRVSKTIVAHDLDAAVAEVVSGQGVGRGVGFVEPLFMAVTSDQKDAFVFDASECRVIRVDMATGDRTLVSDRTFAGLDIYSSDAILADESATFILVGSAIIRVDSWTGGRDVFAMGSVANVTGTAFDAVESRLLVVDSGLNKLSAIRVPSGRVEIISGPDANVPIATSRGLALTPRRTALVFGAQPNTIVEIDLGNGARRTWTIPLGAIRNPGSLAYVDGRLFVTELARGLIHRVDLAAGTVETLHGRVGHGVELGELGVAIGISDGQALILDSVNATVVGVDLDTGARGVVSKHPAPLTRADSAPVFDIMDGAHEAIVLDRGSGLLVRLDLESGEATTVASEPVYWGSAIRIDEVHNRGVVLDSLASTGAIVTIDLDTGVSEVVADAKPGFRVFEFGDTGGLALHPDGETAYLARPDAVVEKIDLETGERIQVLVTGTPLAVPTDAVYDPAGEQILVLDKERREVVAIDPETGISQTISGGGHGAGPALRAPESFVLDVARNVLHMIDDNRVLAIELTTGARVVTTQ